MKPYSAQLAVGGAKLVTENGYAVRDVIFSVNYIAGIIHQKDDFLGAMGLWDKTSGKGVQINKLISPDLKMYEEPPKEYWLGMFTPEDSGSIIGGVFKTEKEAITFNGNIKNRRVIKVVEVK